MPHAPLRSRVRRFGLLCLSALLPLHAAPPASAAVILNPSFEDPTPFDPEDPSSWDNSPGNWGAAGVPDGWTLNNNSGGGASSGSFTWVRTGTHPRFTPYPENGHAVFDSALSPSAAATPADPAFGAFMGFAGTTSFSAPVTGLVPGAAYRLEWRAGRPWQAPPLQGALAAGTGLLVTVGGGTPDFASVSTLTGMEFGAAPSAGTGPDEILTLHPDGFSYTGAGPLAVWRRESLIFTATAAVHTLTAGAFDTGGVYVLADHFILTPVPEPSAAALLAGALFLPARRRPGSAKPSGAPFRPAAA